MRAIRSVGRSGLWIAGLLTVAGLALAGCRPHRGTIIAKQHVPESCAVQVVPLLLADKREVHRGRIPVLRHVREHYQIQVKQDDGAVEMYFLRSKALFDRLAVGDFYKYDRKTARQRPYVVTVRLTPDEFEHVKALPGQFGRIEP